MNTSDIWKILGIESTTDIEQIREAYLTALPGRNPEDDPAGFMELRAAYDAALREAAEGPSGGAGAETGGTGAGAGGEGSAGAGAPETDDEDLLAIRGILADFPKRMDEREWERLFEKAEVYGIDRQD